MLVSRAALAVVVVAIAVTDICVAECINHPTDVIFLVDASVNDHGDFQNMLDFAVNITEQLDIGPYDYKVGMLIFSRSYRSVFYLSKYTTSADVITAIKATNHNILNRDVTDIGDALAYTRRAMATTAYGHRHGADLVVVTLLAHPSSNPSSTNSNAKLLRDTGATLIAIGIGASVPDSDLAAIASDPAHSQRVATSDDLQSAQWPVIQEICPNDWHTDPPITGAALTKEDCPVGVSRDQYLQLFRGICYQFNVFRTRSFDEATKDCEQNSGTLVLIKNREINFFIQNELFYTYGVSNSAWIGLIEKSESGDNGQGHYVWADGETANYTNFGQTVGHDSDKNCIAIVPQITSSDAGRWREYHCDTSEAGVATSSRLRYVCQYIVTEGGHTTVAPSTLEPVDTTVVDINSTSDAPNITEVAMTSDPSLYDVTTATPNMTTVAQNMTTDVQNMTTDAQNMTTDSMTTISSYNMTTDSSNMTTDILNMTTDSVVMTTQVVNMTTWDMGANTTSDDVSTNQTTPSMPATTMATTQCPVFHCTLNCDLDGYKTDANKCAICECDV